MDDVEFPDFPCDRGGPLDGDECEASAPVCAFPVDAFPSFERDAADEEYLVLPDHVEGLVHLYGRCWTCRSFHYFGVYQARPREGRQPEYLRIP